jgi:hypothetical protein
MEQKPKPVLKKKVGAAARWTMPPEDQIVLLTDDELERAKKGHTADQAAAHLIEESYIGDHPFRDEGPEVLFQRALEGHQHSATRLLELAEQFTTLLKELAGKRPELITPLAKVRGLWPILANNEGVNQKANAEFFAQIGLGSDLDLTGELERMGRINTPKKRFAWLLLSLVRSIRASAIAMRRTIQYLRDEGEDRESWLSYYGWHVLRAELASQIPEMPFDGLRLTTRLMSACENVGSLTSKPEMIEAWWQIAKDLLMLNTDGHPEQFPALRKIGVEQKPHHTATTKKSLEGRIRSRIFTELKEEFVRLANLSRA